MQSMDDNDGGVIESGMVSNAIEKAQRKVEGRNFDIRKQLLEYDDVANAQRLIVYQQRNEILEALDVQQNITNMRQETVKDIVEEYIVPMSMEEQWDIVDLEQRLSKDFGMLFSVQQWLDEEHSIDTEDICERIVALLSAEYLTKENFAGEEAVRAFEKHILLRVLDEKWKEHLNTMDYLRQGIHLRGYAARNPKDEYKREAYNLFENLLHSVRHDVIVMLSQVQVQHPEQAEEEKREQYNNMLKNMQYRHEAFSAVSTEVERERSASMPLTPFVRESKKVGRNELCPCGSGKKI